MQQQKYSLDNSYLRKDYIGRKCAEKEISDRVVQSGIGSHETVPRSPTKTTPPAIMKMRFLNNHKKPTRLERLAKIRPAFNQYSNPLLEPEPWEKYFLEDVMKCIAAAR